MCAGLSRIIVFAVNDSKGCNSAWAWAKSNILLQTDTIILVNVWTNNILLGSRYNKASATASRSILRKYQARCERHGIKCHSIGIEGGVPQAIANAAQTNSCDFIILGSSCTTGYIKRTWTGSLSEKIASLASCPVLSVRKNHKEAGFDLAVLPRRICLSVRTRPAFAPRYDRKNLNIFPELRSPAYHDFRSWAEFPSSKVLLEHTRSCQCSGHRIQLFAS